jgi:hypothetical protein
MEDDICGASSKHGRDINDISSKNLNRRDGNMILK